MENIACFCTPDNLEHTDLSTTHPPLQSMLLRTSALVGVHSVHRLRVVYTHAQEETVNQSREHKVPLANIVQQRRNRGYYHCNTRNDVEFVCSTGASLEGSNRTIRSSDIDRPRILPVPARIDSLHKRKRFTTTLVINSLTLVWITRHLSFFDQS